MAVNKNFVIKNGLEVATDAILVDATTKNVGIGSTQPEFTLDVRGGIGATDIIVTGISSFRGDVQVGASGSIFYVDDSTNNVGVGTSVPNAAYTLDVRSPVSTGQTALYVYGDMRVTGDLSLAAIQDLKVTGLSTFVGYTTFSDYVFIQDGLNVTGAGITADTLNVLGVSTFVGFSTFQNADFTNTTSTSSTITNATVTNLSGTSGTITTLQSTNGNFTNLTGTISTLANFKFTTGIATASTGVVTFFGSFSGDGGGLTGISAEGTIGLNSGGSSAGLGATIINFTGNAIDTVNVSGGIGTVNIVASTNLGGIFSATAFAGYNYLQAPFGSTVNFAVTVAAKTSAHRYYGTGSGNAYVLNGVQSPFLTLTPGRTYRFTLSASDMTSHPFRFYLEADKTTAYTTNVTSTSTYTEIVVTDSTPQVLHYQCSAHEYMGNAVNTNSNYASIGVGSPLGHVGSGVTLINFDGVGVSTVTPISAGIVTAFFNGQQIGIRTSGSVAGYAVTFLDLRGTGVSTVTSISSGIVTAFFEGGGGGGGVGAGGTWSNYDGVTGVTTTKKVKIQNNLEVTGIVTATDFNSSSDISLKENINTVDNALDTVKKLRGVSFDWRSNHKPSYGVIAQELENILPALVSNTDPKSVNYNGIIGVLIEAIKELTEKVENMHE